MIPTIETIVEDVLRGDIPKPQAIAWLHQHAASAGRDLRDDFAATAMQGILMGVAVDGATLEPGTPVQAGPIARDSYRMADAMLRARESC